MTVRQWVAGMASVVVAVGLASGASAAPNGGNSDEARAEHQRIVDFWTPDRVAQAVPRDFAFNPDTGRFVPMAKPTKPGTTLEPIWAGGDAEETTGKVLFQMGASYYVCSASVVQDSKKDRAIVLTAAHCAYDETAGGFAENWMFIPSYDAADPDVTTSGSFCTGTDYGCWTASALVVDNEFATAGGFNTQATQHDFAFAVLLAGGKTMEQLDEAVGAAQAIAFNAAEVGAQTYALGYPQASPYDGDDLRYCDGQLATDNLNKNLTYRLECGMTGGSSGGPWFSPFTADSQAASNGQGTMMSVNSYGYTRNVRTTPYDDSKMMFGPFFNTETETLFTAATTASSNTRVP